MRYVLLAVYCERSGEQGTDRRCWVLTLYCTKRAGGVRVFRKSGHRGICDGIVL